PFQEQALTGKIATAMEIKAKLEGRLGHSVHKTTVYRMLKRHGWRKIVPRTVHVQSDAKQQEDFKKNSRTL
ncbi:helix-turn-helix domain-containing protein, partial [Desulfatibacillum alkenivorans]